MKHNAEVFVGIDVEKSRKLIAIADGVRSGEVRFLGELNTALEAMRRVVQRIATEHEHVHFCHQSWLTGCGLHRLITAMGNACDVVAPSLTRRRSSDNVKTNLRNAVGLAKPLHAGEFTPVWVPENGHEAIRWQRRPVSVPVVRSRGVPLTWTAGEFKNSPARSRRQAVGAWRDTRIIASAEARAHENEKNELEMRDEEGAVISRAHSGHTMRMLRDAFTGYWQHNGDKILLYRRQLQVGRPAPIRGGIEGDLDNGLLPAGQSVGLIQTIKPAGGIVRGIFTEAWAAYRQALMPVSAA